MFGFSFAELIVVFLVILIFIKPQDLPEMAHFFGKIFYRAKTLFYELKSSLKEMEKELGIDELKHEVSRGIAEEKAKIEEDMTVIVDMNGEEHQVKNIKSLRLDMTTEEIKNEVEHFNQENHFSTYLK